MQAMQAMQAMPATKAIKVMPRRGVLSLLLYALCAAAIGLIGAAPAHAQMMLAARVNGVGISFERLERQYEELLRERKLHVARLRNSAQVKGLKREALEQLIRIELLWQEAKAIDSVVSEEEVERALAQVRARFPTEAAFLRRIEADGFDAASHRAHTRKLLSGERMAQRIVARDVRVSERDVEEFYAINPRLFRRDEQVRVRQILVAVAADAGPAEKEQARRKIDALLVRARAGEDFEALARQHSDDATRQWGGALDPFARAQKPTAFEEAAFGLAPGAISDVVETAAGLHIVKLEQRSAAVSVPLDDARQRIREQLETTRGKEAIDRHVEQLRALTKVELLTPL